MQTGRREHANYWTLIAGDALDRRAMIRLAVVLAIVFGVIAGADAIASRTTPVMAVSAESVAPVVITATDLTVPATVPAGIVHFPTSTTQDQPTSAGVIRLRDGLALADYLTDYHMANSTEEATRVEGVRRIDSDAEYFGGVTVTAANPLRFTTLLAPGRYYVINYGAVKTPYLAQSVRPLDVVGTLGPQPFPPRTDASITLSGNGSGSRYETPDRLPAHGALLVTNKTAQLNEVMLVRIPPDTTPAEVTAFWAAVAKGGWPAKNILESQPAGLSPLNPGRCGVADLDFTPGRYLLASFVTDRVTGNKGVIQGFWSMVTLY